MEAYAVEVVNFYFFSACCMFYILRKQLLKVNNAVGEKTNRFEKANWKSIVLTDLKVD